AVSGRALKASESAGSGPDRMGQGGRRVPPPAGPADGTALLTARRPAELKKPCRFPPLSVADPHRGRRA
ncbi:MAG TPA: hypothetical protein VIZ00_13900, partial [Streptosporangiaceae bacterium]